MEYLLEHYQGMVNEIESINATTLTTIQATESLIQLSLDTQRNNLIIFDLRATLGTLCIASSSFLTSIYGMNLFNGMEETAGVVETVALISALVGSVLYFALLRKVKLIRRQSVGIGTWTDKFRQMSDKIVKK